MRRQSKWYRRRTRVYIERPGGVRQVRRAQKLCVELGMDPEPWGELETGSRGGKYLTRGRLYCRECHHLAVRHGPLGCDVKDCPCFVTR